jgi:thiaminase
MFSQTIQRICFRANSPYVPIRFRSKTKIAAASTVCLWPLAQNAAYQYIDPQKFAIEESAKILRHLGANDSLIKVNRVVSDIMAAILESDMVQGMAKGTLTREEWDKKYMRADALYIYQLGCSLAERANIESENDNGLMRELAEMFLGYGRHFERLKKYGLSADDTLICPECDEHISYLTKKTSIDEFYLAILTDMIPYVVFSNYLLHSIGSSDNNSWQEYANKYGDLNNQYAKDKLGKTIQIANNILASRKIDSQTTEKIFQNGFAFEEWFIRNAFSEGFNIKPSGIN